MSDIVDQPAGIVPAPEAAQNEQKAKKAATFLYYVGSWNGNVFTAKTEPFRTLPEVITYLKAEPDNPDCVVLYGRQLRIKRRVRKTTRVFESTEIKLA